MDHEEIVCVKATAEALELIASCQKAITTDIVTACMSATTYRNATY